MSDSEPEEVNRYKKFKHCSAISEDERKLLLQCVSKFQLHKYYEYTPAIKAEINEKWIQFSEILKDKGYDRATEKLGNQYLSLKKQAIRSISIFYGHRRGEKPTKIDYLFAYLFPKYFEKVGLDMNELMADAKVNAKEILESLASTEDQECATILEDTASLEYSNKLKPQMNLKRSHSNKAEGPANKMTKVHEDEATLEPLINNNNSLKDYINALKAKLLDIENKIKEKDHQLELKNLEISRLNDLHAKNLEEMKFGV
ncbi:uncharacterized protein LOC114326478 [Diabrotica virgifera virgifera]|uniref:Uncharacterized protein LOC114326478 n=1 Tax=Diabrotica virgifera virgifera TaxID=50390 RepID=A0A6P7F750_DIAVI|nr:uncharacterized protein LOC114326478 [Diabrotica virgifera virgifera]